MNSGANESDGKRRKSSPCTPRNIIAELPDVALSMVAGYLPKTSVAFLAVAMTAPSASWRESNWQQIQPSSLSKAIMLSLSLSNNSQSTTQEVEGVGGERQQQSREVRRNWDVLDLSDIINERPTMDKEDAREPRHIPCLARKMTDDDLGAALVCINAKNNLKKLKLISTISDTGWYRYRANITGTGLEPLRGSTTLEQIDLDGETDLDDIMSEEVVLPILRSIINAPGCSLRQLELRGKWRQLPQDQDSYVCLYYPWGPSVYAVDSFLIRYNSLLQNRPFNCAGCISCRGSNNNWGLLERTPNYGRQSYTCYSCLNNFCEESPTEVRRCAKCYLMFCSVCVVSVSCSACGGLLCNDCGEIESCNFCFKYICGVCDGGDMNECENCNRKCCDDCAGDQCFENCGGTSLCRECNGDSDLIYNCDECHASRCQECLLEAAVDSGGIGFCTCCSARAAPALIEELTQLRDRVEELEYKMASTSM